ncbi:hypothetical protein CLBKND_03404 [Methylorubrum aminovorans]
MNRRSVLRFLGLAPISAPAAVVAASGLEMVLSMGSALTYKPLPFVIDVRSDGTFHFASPADAAHAEVWNSATTGAQMIERIDRAVAGRFA